MLLFSLAYSSLYTIKCYTNSSVADSQWLLSPCLSPVMLSPCQMSKYNSNPSFASPSEDHTQHQFLDNGGPKKQMEIHVYVCLLDFY